MKPAEIVEQILNTLAQAAPTGFAIGLHVRFITSRFLFQTYRRTWMEEYSRRGLILLDPTVHWGLSHDGWILWRDLESNDPDGVLKAARDHGMAYGVTIAMTIDGSKSFGSLSAADRDFTEAEVAGFAAAIREMHMLTKGDRLAPDGEDRLRRLAISSTHS